MTYSQAWEQSKYLTNKQATFLKIIYELKCSFKASKLICGHPEGVRPIRHNYHVHSRIENVCV